INLLGNHTAGILAEVIASGENIVRRDGISYSHPCRCIPIGTMNPEERSLRPQLLDKFGLFVNVTGENDVDRRTEIIRRRLEYESDPESFCNKYRSAEEQLQHERLPKACVVSVSEEILRLIALTANKPAARATGAK
ncbi:MAG: magnesium chelatase ATPase subunit I, partial [Clostridia bacterium]